ncbi:MAG TPA: hypothetical protein VM008_21185 [Phycisphaerae bacterium]|nr:hypothetical protein [Phycisphaerae bacterium]
MSLLNVRLNKELDKKIKALRKDGVAVSDLLRDAVNQAFARRAKKTQKDRVSILEKVYAQYPPRYTSLGERYDLASRHQARAAMLETMLRKERRRR